MPAPRNIERQLNMNHELPPPDPERPRDDQLIEEGMQHAEANGITIADSTARRIAMRWHGNEESALYAFAHTGAIKLAGAVGEVNENLAELPIDDEERRPLGHLKRYLLHNGERGPIDGWYVITDDDLRAVIYLEAPKNSGYIGRFATERACAEAMFAASGLPQALREAVERCGRGLAKYVIFDIVEYTNDLQESVLFLPHPNGGVEAYWKS